MENEVILHIIIKHVKYLLGIAYIFGHFSIVFIFLVCLNSQIVRISNSYLLTLKIVVSRGSILPPQFNVLKFNTTIMLTCPKYEDSSSQNFWLTYLSTWWTSSQECLSDILDVVTKGKQKSWFLLLTSFLSKFNFPSVSNILVNCII